MKRLILALLILLIICPAFAEQPIETEQPALVVDDWMAAEPMLGGWENYRHEAVELPADAQAAFDKAAAEFTPVALLSTQVVAGMNYCILCQKPEGTWALVYIYADLEGNAEVTNVYELYIERHSTAE